MALRYADTVSTGAVVVTPRFLADWGSGFVDASATFSQFTQGGWSTQGLLSGSRFFPTGRAVFGEIAGLAGGSTHNDGTRTGEVVANGRMHFSGGSHEAFFGAGAGRTYDGAAWRSLLLGELGVSFGTTERNALLTFGPAMVNDSIKYADLQASLTWQGSAVDLSALAGTRFGDQLTTLSQNTRAWASVSAAKRILPRLSLTVSGGSYPIDPTQGFPGGRFISVGLRLSTNRRSTAAPFAAPIEEAPIVTPAPEITSFTARRDAGGLVTLLVSAPGADSVEINGDFTNWEPLSLHPDPVSPGQWSAALPIAPGKYQMNIRVNGGKWVVPPGILSMLDEFGGTVGLLIVQ
jgi:hypothetical protein